MALRSEDFPSIEHLTERYVRIRRQTLDLCRTLEPEDFVIQSMPTVSPVKWHLAHTTWFFEQFILLIHLPNYSVFDDRFDELFNSYYQSKGVMYPRDQRGLLSRPGVAAIKAYREYVDDHMLELVKRNDVGDVGFLVELGLNHEQQHQELLLTDVKHVFSVNPIKPAFRDEEEPLRMSAGSEMHFVDFQGGVLEIGADGSGFCFDNEMPRHQVMLSDFRLADRLITNGEYREFIEDGGYDHPMLWLADGWAWRNVEQNHRPLYWSEDLQSEFTLAGTQNVVDDSPVCHINFFEADAFARWAGARLPTEQEWEIAAGMPVEGNFLDSGFLHPQPDSDGSTDGPRQMFGDTWEWTRSSYSAYPGFRPLTGSLGEYNGKFMCSQMVCRGGSCATPTGHMRSTYRNFFYPQERWQFFGLRLAQDI